MLKIAKQKAKLKQLKIEFLQGDCRTVHAGFYIFDIFNLDYLKAGNKITKLTGDWMTVSDGQKFREIQFRSISDDGILASYSTYVYQDGNESPTKL